MVDENVIRTRSSGISAEGVKDQYADGKAAKVWEIFIGDKRSRTDNYRNFLVNLLKQHGCKRILDVACGTGVDSILLVEEGFEVVSADISDKMLKYALQERWERRKEKAFDDWVIEEANWLTVAQDLGHLIGDGFDAVICLGNSFAHMTDSYGDQRDQKLAIANFERCVKPGGLLLIDHRNYDNILKTGSTPSKCIYYNNQHMSDIKTSVLYVSGKPSQVILDYSISNGNETSEFRLSYYPHKLEIFKRMLEEVFGKKAKYNIYGDFKLLTEVQNPGFYIHVVQKAE
ncbi:glycine N-methyltransferase [Lutzomyia longipalpis]|uniref:glycine N-methyltransferase n=1 Tax=Lutzomyia longipalpis TaxID=7200 RepID=UPI002484703E|nr:glycine N-methyltransferase [Lutzomyia longipalpis]